MLNLFSLLCFFFKYTYTGKEQTNTDKTKTNKARKSKDEYVHSSKCMTEEKKELIVVDGTIIHQAQDEQSQISIILTSLFKSLSYISKSNSKCL